MSNIHIPIYFRYVDDCLLITDNKEKADELLQHFNNLHPNIKFTIEYPHNDSSLSLLDFNLKIQDGVITTAPYTKKVKTNVMFAGDTALPTNMKHNIILNESDRIRFRCSNHQQISTEKQIFVGKLRQNNHSIIPPLTHTKLLSQQHKQHGDNDSFYLSIPFINDQCNTIIKRILKPLHLNIRITHKGKKLSNYFTMKPPPPKCSLKNCPINSHLCHAKMLVYQSKCNKCLMTYIGSTKRPFHIRIKEHLTNKSSSIYQHNNTCGGKWSHSVIYKGYDLSTVRMREALLIRDLRPSINKKEEMCVRNITLV